MKAKDFFVDICPISPADIPGIKKLEQECDLSPWSIEDYYAEVERVDSIALVAKIKNKSVGFIVARLITTSDTPLLYVTEIYNICVARECRSNGIGRLLIIELIEVTNHKVTSIWLEVRKTNEKAIFFYSKLGFEAIGIRRNFYRNPAGDGLIMRKNL